LIFNTGGIIFYTTNQGDYELFHDVIAGVIGFSLGAGVGAGAGQLVNSLVKSLPQYPAGPSSGSEVIEIEHEAQLAVQGTSAETQVDAEAAVLVP
jgi:hypothetical protein